MSIFQTDRDKIYLLLIFIGLLVVIVHLQHHDAAGKTLDWAMTTASNVVGSFLAVITGIGRAGGRIGDKPNGSGASNGNSK